MTTPAVKATIEAWAVVVPRLGPAMFYTDRKMAEHFCNCMPGSKIVHVTGEYETDDPADR